MTLQKMRLKAGLSQSQLAKLSGVKLRTIQHYECGDMDIDGAKLKTILQLANALNCNVVDILNSDEVKKLLHKTKIK